MKLVLGLGVLGAAMFAVAQTGSAQTAAAPIKVLGCLQGDGSDAKPWVLAGVALPAPPAPAPAAAPGGGGGRGGGRGAGGGAGAAPGGGAAGGGRGGGGRGGGGGAAAPPPPPPPPAPLVDLRLAGVDMSPWRGMKVEVEGTLGARPATGPQEFRVTLAHSVQGLCTPK